MEVPSSPVLDENYPDRSFYFQQRRGRLDLRALHSLDLERIVQEVDIDSLQAHLENLTFCNLREQDLKYMTDPHVIKLFRVAQMIIEYLLYAQENLAERLTILAGKYSEKKRILNRKRSDLASLRESTKHLQSQIHAKKNNIATIESLLKQASKARDRENEKEKERERERERKKEQELIERGQDVVKVQKDDDVDMDKGKENALMKYGHSSQNNLHNKTFKIFVCLPDGLCIPVAIADPHAMKVSDLIHKIRSEIEIKDDGCSIQRLVFKGQLLLDSDATIAMSGIRNEDTLVAVVQEEKGKLKAKDKSIASAWGGDSKHSHLSKQEYNASPSSPTPSSSDLIALVTKQQDTIKEVVAMEMKRGIEHAIQAVAQSPMRNQHKEAFGAPETDIVMKFEERWAKLEESLKDKFKGGGGGGGGGDGDSSSKVSNDYVVTAIENNTSSRNTNNGNKRSHNKTSKGGNNDTDNAVADDNEDNDDNDDDFLRNDTKKFHSMTVGDLESDDEEEDFVIQAGRREGGRGKISSPEVKRDDFEAMRAELQELRKQFEIQSRTSIQSLSEQPPVLASASASASALSEKKDVPEAVATEVVDFEEVEDDTMNKTTQETVNVEPDVNATVDIPEEPTVKEDADAVHAMEANTSIDPSPPVPATEGEKKKEEEKEEKKVDEIIDDDIPVVPTKEPQAVDTTKDMEQSPTSSTPANPEDVPHDEYTIIFSVDNNPDLASYKLESDCINVMVKADILIDDLVFELRRGVAELLSIPLGRVALNLHGRSITLGVDADNTLTAASAAKLAKAGELTVKITQGGTFLSHSQLDKLVDAWESATKEDPSLRASSEVALANAIRTGGGKSIDLKDFERRSWDNTKDDVLGNSTELRRSLNETMKNLKNVDGLTDEELDAKLLELQKRASELGPPSFDDHLTSVRGNLGSVSHFPSHNDSDIYKSTDSFSVPIQKSHKFADAKGVDLTGKEQRNNFNDIHDARGKNDSFADSVSGLVGGDNVDDDDDDRPLMASMSMPSSSSSSSSSSSTSSTRDNSMEMDEKASPPRSHWQQQSKKTSGGVLDSIESFDSEMYWEDDRKTPAGAGSGNNNNNNNDNDYKAFESKGLELKEAHSPVQDHRQKDKDAKNLPGSNEINDNKLGKNNIASSRPPLDLNHNANSGAAKGVMTSIASAISKTSHTSDVTSLGSFGSIDASTIGSSSELDKTFNSEVSTDMRSSEVLRRVDEYEKPAATATATATATAASGVASSSSSSSSSSTTTSSSTPHPAPAVTPLKDNDPTKKKDAVSTGKSKTIDISPFHALDDHDGNDSLALSDDSAIQHLHENEHENEHDMSIESFTMDPKK